MLCISGFGNSPNKTSIDQYIMTQMHTLKKRLGSLTFLVFVVSALFLFLSGIARANDEFSITVWCYDDDPYGKSEVRGNFEGSGNVRKSRLFLFRGPKPAYGCMLQYENNRPVSIGSWDAAEFIALCRDPATGTEQLVMDVSAGQHSEIQVWSVESANGVPVLLYEAALGDELSHNSESEEWDIAHLRNVDGTCRWREWEKAHRTFKAAIRALRIGAKLKVDGSEITLPTRQIPPKDAREWLKKLVGLARLEGAVYADAAGRSSWRVVQVLGTRRCDAEGVVLVLERERNSWRTIFDVPSGCTKFLNFPMRGMLVKGDLLYVSMCDLYLSMRSDCSNLGDYDDYVINLRTHHATPIVPGSEAPGPLKPSGEPIPIAPGSDAGPLKPSGEVGEDERFMIHDLDEYLSSE